MKKLSTIEMHTKENNENESSTILDNSKLANSFSFIQEEMEVNTRLLSYSVLLQEMQTVNSKSGNNSKKEAVVKMNDSDNKESFYRNIFIWLPITLFFILYFVIHDMVNMSVHKSSILYAKYGTNKADKLAGGR